MNPLDILQWVGLGGGVLVILAILRRFGLLGGAGSKGTQLGRDLGQANQASRRSESEASQERERKDDEAAQEVMDRPRTDDPAADLRDRLYGDRDRSA